MVNFGRRKGADAAAGTRDDREEDPDKRNYLRVWTAAVKKKKGEDGRKSKKKE